MRLFLSTFAIACLSLQVVVAQPPQALVDSTGLPDETWNAVFARTDDWTGGDVAGSIDLGDNRTVWTFGDTWYGPVRDGKHAAGSLLINNSLAVHKHQPDHQAPAADALQFLAGGSDTEGGPTAWAKPLNANESDDEKRTWFWANGGGIVVPGNEAHGARLIIFLFHLGKRADGNGIWSFQSVGGAMAIVDRLDDPPSKWQPRIVSIPHCVASQPAQTRATRDDQKRRETSWGVSAVRDDRSPYLFLYGVRVVSPLNKQLLLARVPADSIEKFDQWKFFVGKDRWSSQFADSVAIADNVPSELSISKYVDAQETTTWIMIHSEPLFGSRIMARTAARPEGPWSESKPIYTVPDVSRNESYFTYAAKGHLHLSRPGELLVSYLVNSHDFNAMVNDASIYRPKFIRIPIEEIMGKERVER
jgi:hypothetical protein